MLQQENSTVEFEGKYQITGQSFSEALVFASINPQYDNRLFMELPWKLQAQNMDKEMAVIFFFV